MKTISAIAQRPLDGQPIGSAHELPEDVFEQLKARGVVKAAPRKATPKADPAAKQEKAPRNKKAADPANK